MTLKENSNGRAEFPIPYSKMKTTLNDIHTTKFAFHHDF